MLVPLGRCGLNPIISSSLPHGARLGIVLASIFLSQSLESSSPVNSPSHLTCCRARERQLLHNDGFRGTTATHTLSLCLSLSLLNIYRPHSGVFPTLPPTRVQQIRVRVSAPSPPSPSASTTSTFASSTASHLHLSPPPPPADTDAHDALWDGKEIYSQKPLLLFYVRVGTVQGAQVATSTLAVLRSTAPGAVPPLSRK